VGVVGDARHFGLEREAQPEAYLAYAQSPAERFRIVLRTVSDPAAAAGALRSVVRGLDRDLPVSQIRTLEELLADSSSPRRLNTALLGLFAGLALVLAALGVYAVISYSVEQRSREIGISLALGADRRDVLRSVAGRAMIPALAGVVIGLALAALLTRWMATLLYAVSPVDPPAFFGVALLLSGVALAACVVPALRATRVDPIVVLRHE
jgi:putative ABC transport system permease protein